MARYGTFKYGDGTKYGASSNDNLLYALEIDWDDDDLYDGGNEARRIFKMRSERGRNYLISGDGKGFDPEQTGILILTVDNYDGRFDPYNAGGDLYGNIEPGKKCKFWVRDGIGGTDYDLFTGVLADVQLIGRNNEADLIIDGAWRWLQDRDAKVELQESKTADQCISAALTAAEWPSEWGSSLDTGPDTIDYWWATGKAKKEIEDLANSGLGNVFVAADGTLKYYSRQKTDDPVMVITEDVILKDVLMPQPWEFKRNIVRVSTHPRKLESSQVIWTHNEAPGIEASESITLWARYKYDGVEVPAKDVITPASTTDYTANAQADGGGADYTSDITVSITKYAHVSKITYTNGNANKAYLTLAQIRGKPVSSPDTSDIIVEGTGASTRPRLLELDLPWQQNYNTGKDLADVLLAFFEDQQYFPTIFVRNRPSIQFGLELYDKVSLTLDTWGIDANFRVGKISHRFMNTTGQDVLTEFKLFPYYVPPVPTYWYLGTVGKSELGAATYLGY